MKANPHLLELNLYCRAVDAAAWPAHVIRLCCDGFRLHIDRAGRQGRLAPVMVLTSFVVPVILALLFAIEHQTFPMLACFAGVTTWIVIFYGLSGQMQWRWSLSAATLLAGRMNAWLAMLGRFMLSGRHVAEQRTRVTVALLAIVLSRLRARLRLSIGLTDPNLAAFRQVPPEATPA